MTTSYKVTGVPFVLVTLALALCTFMEVLDFSIANVSVPYIAGGLGVSTNEGTWVITLYMVGNAIVLPISGWLSEKIGPVRLILIASVLFGITSWFCGVASSFTIICISRFFQGMVSGPLIPVSQTLLVDIFPPGKKQMAMALWAMVALVGPIAGPLVGGWITEDFSWRWIFFINIPVAIFSTVTIWIVMRKYIGKVSSQKLDVIGLILLVVGITSLQILVDKGQQLDWFKSIEIKKLASISFVSLALLVAYELGHPDPLIDLRLFKIRSYALSTFLLAVSFMVFFSPIVITPLWLETFMGYDPLKVGSALATMGIIPFFMAPVVGKLMTKGWQKGLVTVSFLLMGVAFLHFSTFNTSVSYKHIAVAWFFLGLGLTWYIAPLVSLSLSQIPVHKNARAAALLNFFRIFLSGIGTSIYTTLWNDRATFHHSNIASNLTSNSSNVMALQCIAAERGNHSPVATIEVLNHAVDQQAYMLATNDVMMLSGFIMIALIVMVFFVNVSSEEIRSKGMVLEH